MAGVTDSWINTLTETPTPCITDTTSTFSNCVLWLIVGLFIGSLTKKKAK